MTRPMAISDEAVEAALAAWRKACGSFTSHKHAMEQALAAADAVRSRTHVVVPREPTEAMLNATMKNEHGGLYPRAGRAAIYRAMIAAGDTSHD